MAKVSFYTVGCKLNQYETELIARQFERLGYKRVDWADEADIYIINSCNVTKKAAADSRRKIFSARKTASNAKIVITGCYAHLQSELIKQLPEIDFVISNEDKPKLIEKISHHFPDLNTDMLSGEEEFVDNFKNHTRALVKIQDGCNQNCSYCIIPQARGDEISREPQHIINEIEAIENNNYHEIVLTGVHIGRYKSNGLNLYGLLMDILDNTKVPRIRLSSLEVNEIDESLISLISTNSRICPHLHIPLQSGSEKVLKAMRRPYKSTQFLTIIEKLKACVDNIMIGADVIVGFPGEGEEEFARTMDFIENSPVDYLHIFSYSDHPQALSFSFDNKVGSQEIKTRNRMLTSLGDLKWKAFLQSQFNRRLSVLFENRFVRDSETITGLSDNYIRVECMGSEDEFNTIKNVIPHTIQNNIIAGKII